MMKRRCTALFLIALLAGLFGFGCHSAQETDQPTAGKVYDRDGDLIASLSPAENNTVSISYEPGTPPSAAYFMDYVVKCLLDPAIYNMTYDQICNGGLKIYTTLDSAIQAEAGKTLDDPAVVGPFAEDGVPIQGSIVMVDNATGDVVCLVGGHGEHFFNRATEGKRQPGIAGSPLIVYAPALELGYSADTVFEDAPITVDGYSPKNIDGLFRGPITMRQAVRDSVSIYAVKLYAEAGTEYCWNFAQNNMGINLQDNASSHEYKSNAVGGWSTTPLEITMAYSAFPNKGIRNIPRCVTQITDSNGSVLLEAPVKSNRVMKETTASVMNDLLRSDLSSGAPTSPIIGKWYIGGTTGITFLDPSLGSQGTPNAWFLGYSPLYTGAVWLGYDITNKDHFLTLEYSNEKPSAIWKQIMQKALEGLPVQSSISE